MRALWCFSRRLHIIAPCDERRYLIDVKHSFLLTLAVIGVPRAMLGNEPRPRDPQRRNTRLAFAISCQRLDRRVGCGHMREKGRIDGSGVHVFLQRVVPKPPFLFSDGAIIEGG